ncbi:MAG: hypothetical protein ABIS36_24385 [Chryseolinea sp.]
MKKSSTYIVLVSSLIAFAFAAASNVNSYNGYAYEKGKKIYTESFTEKFVDGKQTEMVTLYYSNDKKLIAKRTLDYTRSLFTPDFITEDLRTGFMEGAEMKGKKVRLFFRKDKDSKLEEKTLEIPQPMIVDGGFNQYIKSNWDKLKDGKMLTFYFTVSNKLDYFKLRASKVRLTDKEMSVRIEPDRSVIRWISSPIVVKYDVETRRIVSYEGKSNIQDENGSNPVIRLEYPKKGP